MRVRAAVVSWAILLGCGGARDTGGGATGFSYEATTPPPATPSASSTGGPVSSTGAPQSTPIPPPDSTPAPPDTVTPGIPPSPTPPDNTATPAPPPPAASRAWAGTQAFTTPWTEIEGVATLPSGRLVVFGSQFVTKDGNGSRRGTLAWTDAAGKVERVLEVQQADEIFGMAVSASSGAIALAGYTQGTGGYLLALDADGAQQWLVSMGREVAVYAVTFAPNGEVVACGSDPNAFIGRWAPDGTLLWRKTYPVSADGFSFGIAMTPSGDIAAAGGRDPVIAVRTAPDGTTRWTRTLALGSPQSGRGAIATDAAGAVLLAGREGNDAFVAKLDSAGDTVWVQTIATDGVDTANGIAVDPAGDAVVVGSYGLGSGGTGTGYVARYDASGNRVWTTDVNWPGIEVLGGVALDTAGNAFVVGSFPSDAFGFQTQGFVAKVDRAGVVQ
jgi:PQQ-like domain